MRVYRTMWEMASDYLRGYKVPAIAVLLGGVALYLIMQWADIRYVTTAQAEQNAIQSASENSSMLTKIEANGKKIDRLEYTINLDSVRRDITDIRNQQYSLSAQIQQVGETALSRQRGRELSNTLLDLEKRESCMTNKKQICQ